MALSLVFSRLSAEDRAERVAGILADAASGRELLAGLLEARRGGRVVGAVFSQVQAGKTALVWPPRLVAGEPATTAEQLLARTSRWLDHRQVRVAHALLETVTQQDDALLRGAGYEPLAELLYLVSLSENVPNSPPAGPLEYVAYSAADEGRLARVIEATYEQTLDCPQLNGVRPIEEILAGYRAAGVFDPTRWLIIRHGGRDIGCLLLTDHPEHGNWELVYMGLVVSARGNGWGSHIARRAQWLAREAGRPRLVLAVDAANAPAIRLYELLGFRAWDRRGVYLKILSPGG